MKKVAFAVLMASGIFLFADVPVIKKSFTPGNVEIKETGSVVELSGKDRKPAPGSAAAKVASSGSEFIWKPSVLTTRTTGGADIVCTRFSSDGSLAVICERIGGAGNPNGMRLISADTVSGRVINASEVLELNLFFAELVNDTRIYFAATDPANSSGTYFLGIIDVASGEVIRKSADIPGVPQAMAVTETHFYILNRDTKTISVFCAEKFVREAGCKAGFVPQGITISEDGGVLAVYGGNTLDIYDAEIHNGTLYRKKSYTAPESSFSKCVMADPKGDFAVVFSPGGNAYFTAEDRLVKLDIICGENAAACSQERLVLIENRVRVLEMFKLPELERKAKIEPRKMRPICRNDNTAVTFAAGRRDQLLLADHRGNIWHIRLTGKRGKKTPVLIVDGTGVNLKK